MFFWFVIVILLCIYKMNLKISFTDFFDDYMSKGKSASIKGLFVLLVFLSHIKSYCTGLGAFDSIYIAISNMLGQLIVTPFLFYSGYGVMKQFLQKESAYINEFPKKRILCTLINFDMAVLLFLIFQFIFGKRYTVGFVLGALIGWNSLGNSNWYIFSIIILYIFTYLCFKVSNGNRYVAINGVIILTAVYVFLMPYWKDTWWYDTVFCYVAGMIFADLEDKWEVKAKTFRNYAGTLGVTFSFLVLALKRGGQGSIVSWELEAVAFVLLIVIAGMKVSIDNGILRWLGKHVFSIYILQRISFLSAEKFQIIGQMNDIVLIGICLAFTLVLAIIFDTLVPKVDKLIERI